MSDSYIVYVCDTETTGLIPGENEIIELSLSRLYIDNADVEDQKTWLIRAMKPETIQEEALGVNEHKREDILHISKFGRENYIFPKDVLPQIENWIAEDNMSAHDRVLAGQNVEFDYNHMYAMWKTYDSLDTFPFTVGHNKLVADTKLISILIDLCNGKKREKYNLFSLVKAFGIKQRKAHKAAEDTAMTKELLVKQINGIKEAVRNSFSDCY
jgi:DNA polymerase III epsilon subunit-like protein